MQEVLKSRFVRNVAVLASGTGLALALTALVTPILSRLYDPVDFGILGLFASIVSILAEAASGRYELTIVLPTRERDARSLVRLSLLVVCLVTALSVVGVWLFGDAIARRLNNPDLAPFLWWVPPTVLAMGMFRTWSNLATRHQRFPAISFGQIARSLALVSTQLGLGVLGLGPMGLIGGRVAGEAASAIALRSRLGNLPLGDPADGDPTDEPRGPRELAAGYDEPRGLRELAAEYVDFPKFNLPQSLLSSFSQSIPPLLMAAYFETAVVGIYTMAHRLLVLPTRLISQSVRQVFFQRASELQREGGSLSQLLLRTTGGLIAVVIVPTLLVVIFGPWLFETVLGEKWYDAGQYARWMIVWLFFVYINPPAIVLTQVLRKNHYLLVYDSALFVCRLGALVYGGKNYGPVTTIAIFSVVGAVFNAGLITFMYWVSRRHEPGPGSGSGSEPGSGPGSASGRGSGLGCRSGSGPGAGSGLGAGRGSRRVSRSGSESGAGPNGRGEHGTSGSGS